ncbi:MAG: tRNA uridine-5-carboxymethylaminomethyl(34) synthesis enzyme MnmG [Christensenellaceae bacterium]|nr:tRNA uridine-5-carboxymethylaminomethyl(34) synthesis enzyme MnmG [Christensenellaceae bacterium]
MTNRYTEGTFDAVVIGAGHAGCEAALALSRTGMKTALLTLNLDGIAFMACNPSIGGTAKGHLVRELDALGGMMGVVADKTMLQIKMLNRGKGAAVQSLRAQADKNRYHTEMKKVVENAPNITIVQCEAREILTENGKVTGVVSTYGGVFYCRAVVVATGVYLGGKVFAGEFSKESGPNGFANATELTKNLVDLGFSVRRFKTGTPARVDGRTIDYSKCEIQLGETDVYPFSYTTERIPVTQTPCYLTYTNEKTHEIIRANLHRSPLYGGAIKGIGPRYCPSIEDKVVRFADKDRHQLFLEPEGADTNEVYVQGMSTSLPHDVQRDMYRTIAGLENVKIMRYAYAIEYDCIDTLDVYPTLGYKKIEGLFTAGQVNGTSGYEEAAVQGLIAGANASLYLREKEPLILGRNEAYAGVLIDDLVTKGTNEPYRIMTSRAEYRLILRQDNADFRLTEKGRKAGLISDERYEIFLKRKELAKKARAELKTSVPLKDCRDFVESYGGNVSGGMTVEAMIKRNIPIRDIKEKFGLFKDIPNDVLEMTETDTKYEGYLKKGFEQIEKTKRLEDKQLPKDIDYLAIDGLRIEARQKLDKIRPASLGQASRISGVNPADIAVLMVYLKK